MFFQSWQLWEKMSFILGMGLITVFMFGWAKMALKVRFMKKQEVMDEEKRARRQELRANNQRGDARGKHEIPFGIRAIQSGIQVDGIWISNPNTPVPSEVTLSSIPYESSDDMSKNSTIPISKVVPQARPKPSIRGRPDSFGSYRAKSETLQDIMEGKATRISYKPRRSSQLRYEGQGDILDEALENLEGVMPIKNKPISFRSRRYNLTDRDPDSSAADNERNSGTSDESDATLSIEPSMNGDRLLPTFNVTADDNTEKTLLNDSPLLSRKSLDKIHDSKVDVTEPTKDVFNDEIPSFLDSALRLDTGIYSRDTTKDQPTIQSSNLFKPGELHMNKTSRKVNTGFEVLPAGTFGLPKEFNTNVIDHKKTQATDKRLPTKLQKKPPDSVS
ncbi:hypothetical protein OnM2_047045 [Erysiphe neolycopersici]|uniref:Uncharacterized protein n=1 Tax=Erysiphe neolycopersici TaxID=212602 RepID=A0A420HTQ6_9PEZI|nr:hypothetical protein OnM2_047045 [Erysiphe neolycopersici]